MLKIIIDTGKEQLAAELNDGAGAAALIEKLPATVRLSRWGDEYYGGGGVRVKEDDTAREIMEVGELALWPPGNALCIFSGPTPASTDDRPRAASPVIPIGKLVDDPAPLKGMGGSMEVSLRREEG